MLEFLTTHLPEKFFLDTSAFIKNRKGFTLIELVVVIAILGILAGLAIPRFMDATASARGARIVADMRTIDSAVLMYNAKTGNLPVDIAAITTDDATNSQYKLLAVWPTPPTGKAIVTAFNGSEKLLLEMLLLILWVLQLLLMLRKAEHYMADKL